MKNIEEIELSCKKLNIAYRILSEVDSMIVIENVINKFNVRIKTGHLEIGTNSTEISLSEYEYSYSKYLIQESVYIFFDQENHNRNQVICIDNGQRVCDIMEASFGMEYFMTNHNFSYLIAVNWYVIEGAGIVTEWMTKLGNDTNNR